jgi:hypothetical protein
LPNVSSVSVLTIFGYRDTGNIGQTRKVNTETLETLGKQEWSIQKHWKHWANKNGQYRDTGNIG